jgi:hypothetical protein
MFNGSPPAPSSIWAAVGLACADRSVPTAYGPPQRLLVTRHPDPLGAT